MNTKIVINNSQKDREKSTNGGFLFLRNLPKDLKRRFKAACSQAGSTMTREVIRFMEQFTESNQ